MPFRRELGNKTLAPDEEEQWRTQKGTSRMPRFELMANDLRVGRE